MRPAPSLSLSLSFLHFFIESGKPPSIKKERTFLFSLVGFVGIWLKRDPKIPSWCKFGQKLHISDDWPRHLAIVKTKEPKPNIPSRDERTVLSELPRRLAAAPCHCKNKGAKTEHPIVWRRNDFIRITPTIGCGTLPLVEARGVEPLSENLLIWLSPSAFRLFLFPSLHDGGQSWRSGSHFLHDRLNGEKPMHVHRYMTFRFGAR